MANKGSMVSSGWAQPDKLRAFLQELATEVSTTQHELEHGDTNFTSARLSDEEAIDEAKAAIQAHYEGVEEKAVADFILSEDFKKSGGNIFKIRPDLVGLDRIKELEQQK